MKEDEKGSLIASSLILLLRKESSKFQKRKTPEFHYVLKIRVKKKKIKV